MIKEDYILKQVEDSKQNKRTSSFLRNFVFQVVDEAARSIYGENYSNRCAQTSEGIKLLLEEFGIVSKIFVGSLCVLEVFEKNSELKFYWGGFWDDEPHLFNITEFGELVDLTISQLHLDPHHIDKNPFPLLPIWWQPIDRWPPLIKYLPDGPAKYGIPDDDKVNYNLFVEEILNLKNDYIAKKNIEDISYGTIIYNIDTINLLTEMNYPWLKYASQVIDIAVNEYPKYIQAKEEMMIRNYENKKRI